MEIEFDPAKDEASRHKRGISLNLAAAIDFNAAAVRAGDRRDYGEARYRAYGLIGGRLHMLVFTMRGKKGAGDFLTQDKYEGEQTLGKKPGLTRMTMRTLRLTMKTTPN